MQRYEVYIYVERAGVPRLREEYRSEMVACGEDPVLAFKQETHNVGFIHAISCLFTMEALYIEF